MNTHVSINNLNIHVLTVGDGSPTILMLHGWGTNIESMRSTAERLAGEGFEVHALDLPGFGKSQLPPEAWDVRCYAELVLAYMDAAELEQVCLIGHSFGGRISIYLGAEYPWRVRQIVLVDSAGVRLPPPVRIRAYYLGRKVLFGILKIPGLRRFEPPIRDRLRQKFGSADYLSAGPLTETFKQVVNQDLVPFARRIQAPTLLIWGDQDQDTPLKEARILEQSIPDAGLVVFNGAGHYSYLDRPSEFVRIVTNFLRGE